MPIVGPPSAHQHRASESHCHQLQLVLLKMYPVFIQGGVSDGAQHISFSSHFCKQSVSQPGSQLLASESASLSVSQSVNQSLSQSSSGEPQLFQLNSKIQKCLLSNQEVNHLISRHPTYLHTSEQQAQLISCYLSCTILTYFLLHWFSQ